jgi:hypothetical protein
LSERISAWWTSRSIIAAATTSSPKVSPHAENGLARPSHRQERLCLGRLREDRREGSRGPSIYLVLAVLWKDAVHARDIGRSSHAYLNTSSLRPVDLSAGRAGRPDGPRADRDHALRRPLYRRPRRFARPVGRRVLPACLYVLALVAYQAPTLSVSSSASIAASSAWVWTRPSATSWPPDRRTAEANGPAQLFS